LGLDFGLLRAVEVRDGDEGDEEREGEEGPDGEGGGE